MNLAVMILLLVLIAAFVWVGIELALTFRKVRHRVDDVMYDLDSTIQKIDTTVEALQPAITQVEPLVHKAETTVDALSLDLLHVNEILGDVKSISGAAAGATTAVTGVVDKAADAVSGAVSKIAGGKGKNKKEASKLSAAQISNALMSSSAEKPSPKAGFDVEIDDIDDDMVTIESDDDYFTSPFSSQNEGGVWDDIAVDDLDEPAGYVDVTPKASKQPKHAKTAHAPKHSRKTTIKSAAKKVPAKRASSAASKTKTSKSASRAKTARTKKAPAKKAAIKTAAKKTPAKKTTARKTAAPKRTRNTKK